MEYSRKHVLSALAFFVQLAVAFSVIVAAGFSLKNHAEKVLFYAGLGAFVAIVGALTIVVARSIKEGRTPKFRDCWWAVFGGSFLGAMLVILYYGAVLSIYDAYTFATSPRFSNFTSLLLVAFTTLFVGIALFLARLKWRCVYGVSEAVVGVIVGSQRYYLDAQSGTAHAPAPFVVLAILTAGVYLVVRGADNIHQGLTKDPRDPVGQRVISWLNEFGKGGSMEIDLTTSSTRFLWHRSLKLKDQLTDVDEG